MEAEMFSFSTFINQNRTLYMDTQTPQVAFLKGKTTTLRPLEKSDVSLITKWINDPEVTKYLGAYLPMSHKEEADWVENLAKKKQTDIVLGIEVDGKLIGLMGIHEISGKDRTATTGALIGEKEYWGKGYGTDAKMQILNYAFNTLNLRRISSSVVAYNKRSLHYSLHCGYKLEGTRKQRFFRDGRYHDELLLAVFKKDWLPYWKKYQGK
jgi:RimJ/RimL family protein N-acetyltransferase